MASNFYQLVILFFSVITSVQVGATSLLKSFSKEVFKMEVVEFMPIEGHHFELAAPQVCGDSAPISKESLKISCQMQEVGLAKVELNICDDNKTFCKPVVIDLNVSEPPRGFERPKLTPQLVEMKEEIHEELLSGFRNLSLKEAKATAAKFSGPVLIMISTDWCPPCNQSKEYFLSSNEFQEFTKDWLKIYVDGDHENSNEFDQEFSFFEYPTFILTNSNLVEVGRFRDEYTIFDFKLWVKRVSPYLASGFQKVRQDVLARKDSSFKQRAIDLLTFTTQASKEKDLSYVLEMALAKNDKEVLEAFKYDEVPQDLKLSWISVNAERLTPQPFSKEKLNEEGLKLAHLKPSFYTYLTEICKTDKERCKHETSSISEREKLILSRESRRELENLLLLADEFYSRTYFFKSQNDLKAQKKAAKLCADTFEKVLPKSKLKVPRYAMQGILACVRDYDLKRVAKIYLDLIEKYPEDSTFLLRYARFLRDQMKDLKQAKVWILKALEKSYDFNWFYSASLKVQIDQALGHKADARETIHEAYKRLDLSRNPNHASRYQLILSRFRDLERGL